MIGTRWRKMTWYQTSSHIHMGFVCFQTLSSFCDINYLEEPCYVIVVRKMIYNWNKNTHDVLESVDITLCLSSLVTCLGDVCSQNTSCPKVLPPLPVWPSLSPRGSVHSGPSELRVDRVPRHGIVSCSSCTLGFFVWLRLALLPGLEVKDRENLVWFYWVVSGDNSYSNICNSFPEISSYSGFLECILFLSSNFYLVEKYPASCLLTTPTHHYLVDLAPFGLDERLRLCESPPTHIQNPMAVAMFSFPPHIPSPLIVQPLLRPTLGLFVHTAHKRYPW